MFVFSDKQLYPKSNTVAGLMDSKEVQLYFDRLVKIVSEARLSFLAVYVRNVQKVHVYSISIHITVHNLRNTFLDEIALQSEDRRITRTKEKQGNFRTYLNSNY